MIQKQVTAAVLIIGNEILSGRTQDKNLAYIGHQLAEIGIELMEARIVQDVADEIISAVNILRVRYDYLFTTGGIGPTHDDITADCIAQAFGVEIGPHAEAVERLTAHYQRNGVEFNEARQRMTRIPHGAELIDNPVSAAPGFYIENVYVMAGIPKIMQAMLQGILSTLKGGEAISHISVTANVPEGKIADAMEALQADYPHINIGLYPFYGPDGAGVSVVARGQDKQALEQIEAAIKSHLRTIDAPLIDKP